MKSKKDYQILKYLVEDAKHLYELFKDKINKEELLHFVKLLKVEKKMERLKQ